MMKCELWTGQPSFKVGTEDGWGSEVEIVERLDKSDLISLFLFWLCPAWLIDFAGTELPPVRTWHTTVHCLKTNYPRKYFLITFHRKSPYRWERYWQAAYIIYTGTGAITVCRYVVRPIPRTFNIIVTPSWTFIMFMLVFSPYYHVILWVGHTR